MTELEQKLIEKMATAYITSGKGFGKVCFALIKEALPDLAKEAGYVKPETWADMKARAKKRPDLILSDD